jgi:type I restriction enzyme R subunit
MSPHAYTEDQLVEQPAIGLFAALGWQTLSAMEETFGAGGALGRETKGEVVLLQRLRTVLMLLNPGMPPEAIQTAIDELTRDRSSMSLEAANREVYAHMKDGIAVSVPDDVHGGQKTERLRVVDWEHPERNDFLLVSQFSVTGPLYTCRPDLIGFVNGLPWVVIELKKPGVPARAAFDENLTHYKQQIPQLFWYNAVLIASNGTDSRIGSLTADWGRFFEWKRVEREDEPRRVSLEVMLRGTCDRTRLLDIVENFTLFSEHKAGLVKVIGQNHQFLGVNNAITSMLQARSMGHGRGGVFWQTQGSGKSFSMVFFAQKVLRKLVGNWTFVVVTDRVELDEQIAKTFKSVGAVSDAEGDKCHASSGNHLRELLRGNHRYVFTLIHKFQTPEALTDRSDVIVLTDEAHRSQYDTLALNMRSSLPRALFLAFTGTPLIAGEERTKEVFGDYVSIYDFQQSIEDGATVPLFYENRTPELQLVNPNLNDDIYRVIEEAELDSEQEEKLEKVLGRQYHLITRDDRLETVAKDIVQHFLGRGFMGKAMVVSIDKATAIRMYDKVRAHWSDETTHVSRQLAELKYRLPVTESEVERALLATRIHELSNRLAVLTETEMAVIVSPGQNEIEQMRKLGLDIEQHRRRMNESQPGLDERFKDTADPLRLVFVCAMWLTGFDAPSCSTVYLDKPMRNHTLMQTIARANRVFPGKHSGVIVDYANVFASLEKALALYGAGKDGSRPVKDKIELANTLRSAIAEATTFCASHGVVVSEIEATTVGSLARLESIDNAMDKLISPDQVRSEFFGHERFISMLYRAVKPDPSALEFASIVTCFSTLADAIRARLNPNPIDISSVLGRIGEVLDSSITGHAIREGAPPPLDLSKIDFQTLAKRFNDSKHKNTELEVLKAAVKAKLEELVLLNRTRTDFAEKFEELIEDYNAGSATIESLYNELLTLSNSLSEEEQRHVRENMSEEELVIFDILTRPAPELTTQERDQIKKVASTLLGKLKTLLVLNWRQKTSARSKLKLAIEDALEGGLPEAYSPELYSQKCAAVFEHVYESYPERDRGVYAEVA